MHSAVNSCLYYRLSTISLEMARTPFCKVLKAELRQRLHQRAVHILDHDTCRHVLSLQVGRSKTKPLGGISHTVERHLLVIVHILVGKPRSPYFPILMVKRISNRSPVWTPTSFLWYHFSSFFNLSLWVYIQGKYPNQAIILSQTSPDKTNPLLQVNLFRLGIWGIYGVRGFLVLIPCYRSTYLDY